MTEEKVAQIKKELNVDKSDLSATKMKKESAPDVRTSAQVVCRSATCVCLGRIQLF